MADSIIDLHALDEDQRIDLMAGEVRKGLRISFIVETNAKADRYMRKIRSKAPGAVEVERHRMGGGIAVVVQRGQ